jgi:hypothetical protein
LLRDVFFVLRKRQRAADWIPISSLKSIVTEFENRWERTLIDLRDELGHIDQPKASRLFVPIRSAAGKLIFLLPGGSIDLHELFNDTEKLCQVIAEIIIPYESGASAP